MPDRGWDELRPKAVTPDLAYSDTRLGQRPAQVYDAALALVRQAAVSPEQRDLLDAVVSGLHTSLPSGRFSDLAPLLTLSVYSGIHVSYEAAVPLAAALVLLDLGIHLSDDLSDGDLPASWHGYPPEMIALAAAGLISAVPHYALCSLDADPTTVLAMFNTLAQGMLRVGAGQQRDLQLTGRTDVQADVLEACAEAKSGERMAIYCALAAQFAGADPSRVESFGACGRALGTAAQLHSDCHDLFGAPQSADLLQGTWTLPIALYLQKQSGDQRASFLELLAAGRTDYIAQQMVRRRLLDAGLQRHCALIIESYCVRARRALIDADPADPGKGALAALIDAYSFRRTSAIES